MNKEEIEDILEELHLVRPEILKPKAKKLFEAIMSIADERDELKKQLEESNFKIANITMDKIELKKQLENIRLDQTKKVFETLANILNTESCSYRYLIYDLLGFKKENYVDLIAGMSIINAIVELEELKKQLEKYKKELEKADSITQSCIFNGKKESEISFRKCLNMLEDLKEKNQKLRIQASAIEETFLNQQKEFIEYINDIIDNLETVDVDDEEMKGYLIQRIDTFKEILSKYKSIIGDKND